MKYPSEKKNYTIRPQAIGGTQIHIMAESLGAAVAEFAHTVGLITKLEAETTDTQGTPYIQFLLGTGARFYCYETPIEH